MLQKSKLRREKNETHFFLLLMIDNDDEEKRHQSVLGHFDAHNQTSPGINAGDLLC